MMNKENAGGRVFTNIDEALAEKIISRSRENSKETAPVTGNAVSAVTDSAIRADDEIPVFRREPVSAAKIAAVVLALLVLMLLFFRREGRLR